MNRRCFRCGSVLTENFECKSCHKQYSSYQKAELLSALYYNLGLEKAKTRDLSGAADVLKQSIRLNKYHTDARNLLGLIYFEMGETVTALSEWVLSQNLMPDNNIAGEYLELVRKNKTTLENVDNTIKKYNQSLEYVRSGSYDLAVINLKKVVTMNPNFIRAYLLLALLNVKLDDIVNAKRELLKILQIDANHRLARKYYADLVQKDGEEKILTPEEETKKIRKKNQRQILVNQSLQQIAILVLGIALGAGLLYFLVWPYQKSMLTDKSEDLKKQIGILQEENNALRQEKENAVKDAEQKEQQVRAMIKEVQMAAQKTAGADGYVMAATAYLNNDLNAAAEALIAIPATENATLDGAITQLKQLVLPKVSQAFYISGYGAYSRNQFDKAIEDLTLAMKYDAGVDFSDDVIYFLGRTYEKAGQTDKALEMFKLVLEKYPNTDKRGYTEGRIKALSK
ncbi:hypothetical protein EII17_13150 [Clostridiales bacterium COT073_COT-073]|nr:hypothetical protein EII17_13150 [Clostridiales bacterium COT073_COT-073]